MSRGSFNSPFRVSSFLFFFYCSGDPRDLHSFPTRRSSDLRGEHVGLFVERLVDLRDDFGSGRAKLGLGVGRQVDERSEEHTSELQSQSNLVCRLLLEKKKKKKKKKSKEHKQ